MDPRRTGFTLLEVLVSLLLFVGGIAWMLQTSVAALRAASASYDELLAIKGVQQYQLELLRSLSFTDPLLNVNAPAGNGFSTPTLDAGALRGGSGWYWVELESANLKRVTVRVLWTDSVGRTRSSVMSTLISQGGLGG